MVHGANCCLGNPNIEKKFQCCGKMGHRVYTCWDRERPNSEEGVKEALEMDEVKENFLSRREGLDDYE